MSYPTDNGVTYTTKTNNVDIINDSDVNNLQTEVSALKTKVGVDGSAVTSSHDYKLGEITGSDKAVGKTATQTLTNKTLTSPVVNVGSDATGDMYYRNAGVLTRIPIGSDNQIMKINGTTPNWEAESTVTNASTTVAGISELATSSEITAGTATGGTGAALVVTPDGLAASTPVFNGSGLTNLPTTKVNIAYTNVTVTNTTAETTLFSTSVPANTLGTSNGIRLRMLTSLKKGSTSGSPAFALYFKFGGSTIHTLNINDATTFSTAKKGWIEFLILSSGATNTQDSSVTVYLIPDNQPATTAGVEWSYVDLQTGAIDTTSSQTLSVSVKFGTATTSDEMIMYQSVLEKIK